MFDMRLHELMEQQVVTVSANDYAASALDLMRRLGLSKLFVLDRDEITGVVFEQDLACLPEHALRERDVREAMVTNLQVISPDLAPEEASRLLRRCGLTCLVVREGRRLRGVITREHLRIHPGKGNRYATHPKEARR